MDRAEQEQPQAQPAAQEAQGGANIDLQQLADKVYQLMLTELRLERARGAPPPRRRKTG